MAVISALMTCHNRREKTVNAIRQYFACALHDGFSRNLILVDDGSTDGTAEAVNAQFRDVTILRGDGNLFWNRGMHLAQRVAMERDPEYLLWLNDDTELQPEALINLLEAEHTLRRKLKQSVIVVGSTADREQRKLTYGGHVAPSRWKPFSYQPVWHATEPIECHAMNGNVVLIPMQVARSVGNLDPLFEHAMGDTDYALRAREKGFRVFVAPGFVGLCQRNSVTGTYRDSQLPVSLRWKKILSRKGLPLRSWWRFTSSHGGAFWPVYFIWPYFKLILIWVKSPEIGDA